MKESFLHLYLGCSCMIKNFYAKEWVETKITMRLLIEHHYRSGFSYNPEFIKPILRPLSDMSEEENKEYNKRKQRKGYMAQIHADNTVWLLSKHFDLFNLIPEKLAIDAKTLKNSL